MSLWIPWWNAIWRLRPAFSRLRTFLWFATAVAGFTVRTELLGVTSLVRALKLEARFYNKLVDHFHSPAVKLDRLAALWTQTVLRASPEYRDAVRRKLHAYHAFIQAAVVCQGLLQDLAVAFPQRVWDSFGSWLRTIRPGIPPSELVVANALRQSLPDFLLNAAPGNSFAKFVIGRQDTNRMEAFRLAS